jgi:hypothetical protein
MGESLREKITRKMRGAVAGTFGGRRLDGYAQGDPERAKRIVVDADGSVISGPYNPNPDPSADGREGVTPSFTYVQNAGPPTIFVNDGPDHIRPPEEGRLVDTGGEPVYNHFGPGNGVPSVPGTGSFSGILDNGTPHRRLVDMFTDARDDVGHPEVSRDQVLSVGPQGASLKSPEMG